MKRALRKGSNRSMNPRLPHTHNLKRFLLPSLFGAFLIAFFTLGGLAVVKGGAMDEDLNTSRYPVVGLYAASEENRYGGVMSFPSGDDVATYLESYDISGNAEITLYKASEQNLLNYLLHDGENNQKERNYSTADFPVVATITQYVKEGYEEKVLLKIPITEPTGIWFFTVKLGSATNNGFIIKSSFGVTALQEKDSYLYWAQDFETHRSVEGVEVTSFNLAQERKELGKATTDAKGIARTPFSATIDIALARRGSEYALIPLNLTTLNSKYNNYKYDRFDKIHRAGKYFIFTDRPIYKPGDTMYFKVIVRDTEGEGYLIPQDPVRVYINSFSGEEPLFERSYTVSSLGTLDGEYQLPKDITPGAYGLVVSLPASETRGEYDRSDRYFQVEEYRKPEYFLEIASDTTQAIRGNKVDVGITGTFFSGHPAAGYQVSYTVGSSDWYDYKYQEPFHNSVGRYGYQYGAAEREGIIELDSKGAYTLTIDTKNISQKPNSNRLVSVNVSMKDNSGNVSSRHKNFLLFASDYTAYVTDESKYGFRAGKEQGEVSYELKKNEENTKMGDVKVAYSVTRSTWESTGKKGPYGYEEYTERTATIVKNKSFTISPDSFNDIAVRFPIEKEGSYKVETSFTDTHGRTYTRDDWIYAYGTSNRFSGYNGPSLSLSLDKRSYAPDDTAVVTANVPYTTGEVLMAVGKRFVLTHDVVPVNDALATFSIPVEERHLPKISVYAYGFYGRKNTTASTTLVFDTSHKRIDVAVSPDKATYGPGETATVTVTTSDANGLPVPAEVAVWSMDKALLEVAEPANLDVFDTFWKSEPGWSWGWYGNDYLWLKSAHSLENINFYNAMGGRGGGCFAAGTLVTMGDGSTKPIEEVKPGDYVLTVLSSPAGGILKKKVSDTHATDARGLLVINNKLHVTPNHIVYVNGLWRNAGDIQVGDMLRGLYGNDEVVESVEYMDKTAKVYNLTVDDEHTYIADGVWVHNQKGGGARSVFKDTAYWNPSLKTNTEGKATVRFTLPDNLTTWIVNAVAVADETKVGNTAQEVIVTKPVFIRPFVSNMLRVGDTFRLEASVSNFSGSDGVFDYALTAPGLNVTRPNGSVTIPSGQIASVYWDVRALRPSSGAKLTFSASSQKNMSLSDSIEYVVPVTDVSFEDVVSEFGVGDHSFTLEIPKQADTKRSEVEVSLASSITNTLPKSIEYLIDYPYGCTEQTTSRLYALLVAKKHPELFSEIVKGKDIDDMIEKGIARLEDLRTSSAGWGYWYVSQPDPFITMYVEVLLKRLELEGYEVPRSEYYQNQVIKFIADYRRVIDKKSVDENALMVLYDVIVLGGKPDARAVELIKKNAIPVGQSVYWEGGNWRNYGSHDATTGLALQALVAASDPDVDIRGKAIRYLMANKKYAYWSNTFGTVQAAYGILATEDVAQESTSSIPYTVKLGGKTVASGTLSPRSKKSEKIDISGIRQNSRQKLEVSFGKDAVAYTTLTAHWIYTKAVASRDSGLTVKKTYTNASDKDKNIGVGDTVNVQIEVRSPQTLGGVYMVVADELPAGMIPINTNLQNEYKAEMDNYDYRMAYTSQEFSSTGVVMGVAGSQNEMGKIEYFNYQARVVSQGNFIVPPAHAQLMYLPEVSGHSGTSTLRINKVSTLPPQEHLKRFVATGFDNVLIQLKRIYLKVTSPIARMISRQYTDDILRIIALVFGGYLIWRFVKKTLGKSHHHTPHHMDKPSLDEVQEADEG